MEFKLPAFTKAGLIEDLAVCRDRLPLPKHHANRA